MAANSVILWDILIPITIISIIISIIPFIIHIRLRNWPATFMTILFAIYGILVTTNAFINSTIPINSILNLTSPYWFCWFYDSSLSTIKVACTGCYLRLLNRLLIILQKLAAQQQHHQQQRLTYLSDSPHQPTANMVTATIYRIMSPLWNSDSVREKHWIDKLLQAKNSLDLLYQDHHLLLWDIVFIWILPNVYMALCNSVDIDNSESEYFDSSLRYIYYSPSMGCLNRKTYGLTATTIYYTYPFLLMCGGSIYTVLIAIKMKQLKLYFKGKSSDRRLLKRLPFYRLFAFCCLYNFLYVLHLPFVFPNYLTVFLQQRISISERETNLSKNGLILENENVFEIMMVFMYPLLSCFWSFFFGTTQEGYNLYRSVWCWLKNRFCAWRGKQRTIDDERRSHEWDQQQVEHESLLPPSGIYLAPTFSASSFTSTLVAGSFEHLKPSTAIGQDTLSSLSTTICKPRPPIFASSLFDDSDPWLRSSDRSSLSFVPYFRERSTVYHSAYSMIDICPPSPTESSVTLINQCSY